MIPPNNPQPKPVTQEVPEPTPLETLLGGSNALVGFLSGEEETVRVRQLPIRDYPDYLAAQMDEPRMAELLCGKPTGWGDSLEFASLEGIISEGDRLNADFFGRWLRRRLERQERLLPGSLAGVSVTPSPTASPTPPSAPAAGSPNSRT
jgi:hypothetical protein